MRRSVILTGVGLVLAAGVAVLGYAQYTSFETEAPKSANQSLEYSSKRKSLSEAEAKRASEQAARQKAEPNARRVKAEAEAERAAEQAERREAEINARRAEAMRVAEQASKQENKTGNDTGKQPPDDDDDLLLSSSDDSSTDSQEYEVSETETGEAHPTPRLKLSDIPRPSVQMRLPREIFGDTNALSDVSKKLENALDKASYWEFSFYEVTNGFALVTRLERINPDGTHVPEGQRFELPSHKVELALADYIKSLFFAPSGHYRFIVFVVTDQAFSASGDPLDEQGAVGLLHGGASALTTEIRKKDFSAQHNVHALVYEFQKKSKQETAEFVQPGRISPNLHLTNAGLLPALRGRGN